MQLGVADACEADADGDEAFGWKEEGCGVLGVEWLGGDGVAQVEGFDCWGDVGWVLVQDVG